MMKPTACLALAILAVSFDGQSSAEACWKGSTTDGSNPGLNITLLCIAENGLVELKVHFPNTPIQEPPTTCTARGRKTESEGNTSRIVTGLGQCENGNTMGAYDFRCTLGDDDTMTCEHVTPSGILVHSTLKKVFP